MESLSGSLVASKRSIDLQHAEGDWSAGTSIVNLPWSSAMTGASQTWAGRRNAPALLRLVCAKEVDSAIFSIKLCKSETNDTPVM